MAVADRSKVFDLSSLFSSSKDSVKSSQPWNNVFTSKPQSGTEYANHTPKSEQRESGRDQSNSFPLAGSFLRNPHTLTENPIKAGPTPSCLVKSRAGGKGGSGNDCRSRAFDFNAISMSENSCSSAFQNLTSIVSKTQDNFKDDIVLQRHALSSTIELKLGQPSEQSWGSSSTALPAMRQTIGDLQATTLQEKRCHNLGDSKALDHNMQYQCSFRGSDFSRTRGRRPQDLVKNVLDTANGASHVGHLKDGSSNDSLMSVLIPPSNTLAGGDVHQKEQNKGNNASRPFIPCALPFQPNADRSVFIGFSCNGDDGPIRPLGINNLALRKNDNKNRVVAAGCGRNSSNVGSELNFRLHAKQMESSGFFTRNGKTYYPNSCAVSGGTFNSMQKASMLPDVSAASDFMGKTCSLRSTRYQDHLISSSGCEITPPLQATSTSFPSSTVALAPCAPLRRASDVSNPHMSEESVRVLALRSVDQSFRSNTEDSFIRLNQQVQGSSLNSGASEGQRHRHFFSVGCNASPTVLPGIVGNRRGDIRTATTVEGTNNWEDLGASTHGIALHSKVTDEYIQVPCDPLSKEQPSLSLGRGERRVNDCNTVQRCCEGSCRRYCTVQATCLNREWVSKGTGSGSGLKKQVCVAVNDASKINGSRLAEDSSPVEKAVLVECSQKVKEQKDCKLVCLDSQWRDVPSKEDTMSKMRCSDAPACFSGNSREAEDHLEVVAAKCISGSDRIAEFLKEKELPNVSSGCTVPAITQASIEVNKMDSCIADAGDTGYINDQIVDQGSAIDRSGSSVDGTDSLRSSHHVCYDKTRSTKEECLTVSGSVACHSLLDECNQKHSKSKEVEDLDVSGANTGEISNKTQEHESGFTSRKRKRRTNWRILGSSTTDVSLLPSKSLLPAENAADDQPYQDSSITLDANSKDHRVKRRRSSMTSVKMLSRKRDLHGIYNFVDGESEDNRPLMANDDSEETPENVSAKRLKEVKPAEGAKEIWLYYPNSDETLKWSLKHCQKVILVSDENVGNQKAKPVACGKYGIICNQELDIDQLKPPKIVPLSQVLKSSRRQTKIESKRAVPLVRKSNKVHFSGIRGGINESFSPSRRQGIRCDEVPSCLGGHDDTPIHETLQICHEGKVSADSVLEKVGANGSKKNPGAISSRPAAQSKPKGIRMRSLYELSMKGKKFISADSSRLQNVMCAPSTECELGKKASEDTIECDGDRYGAGVRRSLRKAHRNSSILELDALCSVCGISNKDNTNSLLECGHCSIRIHQACYGISRVPKSDWYCRPCRTSSKDAACVLCGYGGGAMTRAFGSRSVVKSLLKAWNIRTESHIVGMGSAEALYVPVKMECESRLESAKIQSCPSIKPVVHNSIIAGLFDASERQWVHMVCGLWTPGTRCPNVDTMSAFDVSGVSHLKPHIVCYICKRPGGSCIRCRVETCYTHFHPWCAHQKGLLQSEVEGADNDKVGFYGRCLLHASDQACEPESDYDTDKVDFETDKKEPTCARTEVYKGKKQVDGRHKAFYQCKGKGGSLVTQVQLDAWCYINRQKLTMRRLPNPPVSDVDHDYRKEYARYKQTKGWKHLVVYKSGIHALGLYTSQFLPRGAVVVEYIGEIVGLRVADKRETEYLSGRKLQYESACYFFRIDKEQIIDATCEGGIARFVNHSCQPNCVARVITVRSEKKVVFFAQRDIYPGEEITYDYHFNHEDEGKKIPCLCNSSNCRRYLN